MKKLISVLCAFLVTSTGPLPTILAATQAAANAPAAAPVAAKKTDSWKNWIAVFPNAPMCQKEDSAVCKSTDCGYSGKVNKKGTHVPIYCFSNHRQTTVSEYDAVESSYELLFTADSVQWTSLGSWQNWMQNHRPGAYAAVKKSEPDAASKNIAVRLIPSLSTEGSEIIVHKMDQPSASAEPGPNAPPSDLDKALQSLFNNDVERALAGYMASNDKTLNDELVAAAAKPQDDPARKALVDKTLAAVKKNLDSLILRANLKDSKWLENTDKNLASYLSKKGINQDRLLQYFCKAVWQEKPTAAFTQKKLSSPPLSIKKRVGKLRSETLPALKNNFANPTSEEATLEEQKSAFDVPFDNTDPIRNLCKLAATSTENTTTRIGASSSDGIQPPSPSNTTETGSGGGEKKTVDNKSNQTAAADNSGLYKDIAGGAFGAVAFGLFAYAAFGPAGLAMGLFAGAVIGAAAIHINNKGLGK